MSLTQLMEEAKHFDSFKKSPKVTFKQKTIDTINFQISQLDFIYRLIQLKSISFSVKPSKNIFTAVTTCSLTFYTREREGGTCQYRCHGYGRIIFLVMITVCCHADLSTF